MLLCLRQKLFKNIFQRKKFPFFDGQRAPQTSKSLRTVADCYHELPTQKADNSKICTIQNPAIEKNWKIFPNAQLKSCINPYQSR